MGLRLYDSTVSDSCYKVRLLLNFLKVNCEIVPVEIFPGQPRRREDFPQLNPLGRLPVFEDADLRLRDAEPILCYIARAYDTQRTWLPADPAEFGHVMMWLSFAARDMAVASDARQHDVFGKPTDIERTREAARASFTVLDDHLAECAILGKTWIAGGSPTIADIACFPGAALSGDGGIGHEPYPYLRNWMRAFRRLPGFTAMPGIPEFI